MALILAISAVAVLVAVRLFMPPVAGLLKIGLERWGKRTTIVLCAVSLVGAALAVALSRP